MGIETKKMTKAIAAAADDNSFAGKVKAWPEQVKTFYSDVRTEMKKVTAPSFKEVQSTTTVVIIAVFLFATFFWIVDLMLTQSLDHLFRYFAHR